MAVLPRAMVPLPAVVSTRTSSTSSTDCALDRSSRVSAVVTSPDSDSRVASSSTRLDRIWSCPTSPSATSPLPALRVSVNSPFTPMPDKSIEPLALLVLRSVSATRSRRVPDRSMPSMPWVVISPVSCSVAAFTTDSESSATRLPMS